MQQKRDILKQHERRELPPLDMFLSFTIQRLCGSSCGGIGLWLLVDATEMHVLYGGPLGVGIIWIECDLNDITVSNQVVHPKHLFEIL